MELQSAAPHPLRLVVLENTAPGMVETLGVPSSDVDAARAAAVVAFLLGALLTAAALMSCADEPSRWPLVALVAAQTPAAAFAAAHHVLRRAQGRARTG